MAQKGVGPWLSGADLDSARTGEREQEGVMCHRLGTPKPREGRQLAKATHIEPVTELAVYCPFPTQKLF